MEDEKLHTRENGCVDSNHHPVRSKAEDEPGVGSECPLIYKISDRPPAHLIYFFGVQVHIHLLNLLTYLQNRLSGTTSITKFACFPLVLRYKPLTEQLGRAPNEPRSGFHACAYSVVRDKPTQSARANILRRFAHMH